tara:strand:- start:602 stop:1174 length:573 start_codon:yes stop_codon:yes gene_type:complete
MSSVQNIPNLTFQNKYQAKVTLDYSNVASMKQTHSNNVIEVEKEGIYNADGLITSVKNLKLVVFTADCMPVVLIDNSKIGAIHIGWKGLENKIFYKALEHFNKNQLKVFIGPHAKNCCYEIKNDLQVKFPNYTMTNDKKLYLDLSREIYNYCLQNNTQIEISSECTIHNESYNSYRRDKTSSRQGTLVWI